MGVVDSLDRYSSSDVGLDDALVSRESVEGRVTPKAIKSQEKAQFTTGPWKAVFGVGSRRDYSIFGSDGRELVESVQTQKEDGVSAEQVLADANIMAAAPDLYKALEAIRDCWFLGGSPEQFANRMNAGGLMDDAGSALAKAEVRDD